MADLAWHFLVAQNQGQCGMLSLWRAGAPRGISLVNVQLVAAACKRSRLTCRQRHACSGGATERFGALAQLGGLHFVVQLLVLEQSELLIFGVAWWT